MSRLFEDHPELTKEENLRHLALTLANINHSGGNSSRVIERAREFEKYLKGDTENQLTPKGTVDVLLDERKVGNADIYPSDTGLVMTLDIVLTDQEYGRNNSKRIYIPGQFFINHPSEY